jgi:hypothetical protein
MAANTQGVTTLSDQIKEVAAYANLSQRASTLLQRFFLKVASEEELKELDDWMHESNANDQLFDLLLDLNRDGTGAGTIRLLTTLAKKPKYKWVPGPGVKLILFFILGFLVLGTLEYLIWPPYPITVTTKEETKTFWMPDSSRVDLMPHSEFTYPSRFVIWREVRLTGSAVFKVQSDWIGALHIKSGENCIEIEYGLAKVLSDSSNLIIQQPHQ